MQRIHAVDVGLLAGLALLLALFAAAAFGISSVELEHKAIQVQAMDGTDGMSATQRNGVLMLSGAADREVVATVRFDLPAPDADGTQWVLWLQRDPVDAIWIDGKDANGQPWQGSRYDFFHPSDDESAMPVGYAFRLPADWQGPVALQLHVRSGMRSALHPMLLSEHQLQRITHLDVALTAGAYAGLFMLALIVLVLYLVTRERAFISAFACVALGLLFLSAANGDLYQLPGFSLLSGWRSQGIWALLLLFCASLLQLVLRYAHMREGAAWASRWLEIYSFVLLALAALCLLDLSVLRPWMQWAAMLAWIGTGVGVLSILVDAMRRRLPVAGWLLGIVLVTLCLALASEGTQRGLIPEMFWIWYGYQIGIVLLLSLLSLSQLSRIGEYRVERDRDQLARIDSERRMQREAARGALPLALQAKLRGLDAGDIEWTAMRLLLEHVSAQVPVRACAVVARGYHGRDLLLVEPAAHKQSLEEDIAASNLQLKRHAMDGRVLQQPLPGNPNLSTQALLPLKIRAPGWGMLLLRRDGSDGFTTDELALAEEFARLVVLHADEVVGTWKLRRSAELDALTGTFNRRSIDQWLARAFTDAYRREAALSLLFIDIDRFKLVNDKLGHAGGDACLREVAIALRGALEEGDFFGRYGGEEFIVLLPARAGAEARTMAERLRAAVERTELEYEGHKVHTTVSIGVATRLDGESTPEAVIGRADKALFSAKRAGRNCVHVAPAMFS